MVGWRFLVVVAPDTSFASATLNVQRLGMPLAGCEPKTGYGIKVYALDLDGKPEWGCLNILTIETIIPPAELKVTGLTLS